MKETIIVFLFIVAMVICVRKLFFRQRRRHVPTPVFNHGPKLVVVVIDDPINLSIRITERLRERGINITRLGAAEFDALKEGDSSVLSENERCLFVVPESTNGTHSATSATCFIVQRDGTRVSSLLVVDFDKEIRVCSNIVQWAADAFLKRRIHNCL